MGQLSATYFTLRPILQFLPWAGMGRLSFTKKVMFVWQFILSFFLSFFWCWVVSNIMLCLLGHSDITMDSRNVMIYVSYLPTAMCGFAITVFSVFYNPKKLHAILQKCDELRLDPLFSVSYEDIGKKIKLIFFTVIPVVVGFVVLTIPVGPFVLQDNLCLVSPFELYSFLYWVNGITLIFSALNYTFQKFGLFTLLLILCSILKKEFSKCNEEFLKMLHSTPTGEKIQRIRKRYFDICYFTEKVDNLFLPFIFVEMTVAFTNICIICHAVIFAELSLPSVLSSTLLIFLYFGIMLFVLIQGSLLYEKSKCCLETCKKLDLTKMDPVAISILTLFVENMRSTDVGLTFLRLFIVDKTAILTVFGTLISYVIVILQLQPHQLNGSN